MSVPLSTQLKMLRQGGVELQKVTEDTRRHAWSTKPYEHISFKAMVQEALEKERMEGTVDQWAKPSRHPHHPEYDAKVEDQTKGDDKPEVQPDGKYVGNFHGSDDPVKSKVKHPHPKAKKISLAALAGFRDHDEPKREKESEEPTELAEFPKDRFEGKVNKDDKQGLPMDQCKVEESTKLKDILRTIVSSGELTSFLGGKGESKTPPLQKMAASQPNAQRIQGRPIKDAIPALNSHSVMKKVRKQTDDNAEVTQATIGSDGSYNVGVFFGGKEHIGKGRDLMSAMKSALETAQETGSSNRSQISPSPISHGTPI